MIVGIFLAAALFECAWPCVRCLEGQCSGSLLFSLFVDQEATAGLRHFAEIYSQGLYWWGAKKPSYRKCIHQRVSSFCLLQSKPSAFSWREAAFEWRWGTGGRAGERLSCVCDTLFWIHSLTVAAIRDAWEQLLIHCSLLFALPDWLKSYI